MSPEYSSKLFSTTTGQFILGGATAWMFLGVFVMARMIDLDG
jgi:Flp pilus assembly protein TadB